MQITVRMPDQHYEQLGHIAAKMGLKKSDITRLAIKQFLDAQQGTDQYQTPYAKARHLIGVAESGISDLGKNHRKHLLEKIKG